MRKIIIIGLLMLGMTVQIALASSGYLLVKTCRKNMLVCKNDKVGELKIDGILKPKYYPFKYLLNSPTELIIFGQKKFMLIDMKTGKKSIFTRPSNQYIVRYLSPLKIFIQMHYGFYRAFVTHYYTSGKKKKSWKYNRYKANDFYFLSNGSHIFSNTRGMGKKESKYYIDLVLGKKQTLYYVSALNGRHRKLVTDKAFFNSRIINNGKHVVYMRVGKVNLSANSKTYILESLRLSDGKKRKLGVISAEVKKHRGGRSWYNRSTPKVNYFMNSPFVYYKTSSGSYKVINVATGWTKVRRLPAGYVVVSMLPTSGKSYRDEFNGIEPFIVLKGRKDLKVIRVSDFKTVMTQRYEGTLMAATYINNDSYKKFSFKSNIDFSATDSSDSANNQDDNVDEGMSKVKTQKDDYFDLDEKYGDDDDDEDEDEDEE